MIDEGIINILCESSDRQLDESIKSRLLALKGRLDAEIKDELLGIIDDCAYAALASDFIISTLHIVWISCGGSKDELMERNKFIDIESKKEEFRSKYKWQVAR